MTRSLTRSILGRISLALSLAAAGALLGCNVPRMPTAAEVMTGPYEKPDFSGIKISYPEATEVKTATSGGEEQHYMIQEPETIDPAAPILIHMHGADGDETQGMDPQYASATFARLRSLLAARGWIYVTPRLADFDGLRKELEAKYGPRKIVLSGASMGGCQTLREAMQHPSLYVGMILMCPAMPFEEAENAKNLTMPVYMECAEADVPIVQVSRNVAGVLKREGKPYIYVEIPGGKHSSPIQYIDWERALAFMETNLR